MIEEIKTTIEVKARESIVERGLYKRSFRIQTCFEESGKEEAQGIPILGRVASSKADPNVKTASDFVSLIGVEKAGYLAHDIQRVFGEDIKEDLKEKYKNYDNLNFVPTIYSDMMEVDAITGNSYALYHIDEQGQVRKKKILPWLSEVFYDENTRDAKYAYICEEINEEIDEKVTKEMTVYVYDTINRYKYEVRYYAESGDRKWYLKETKRHGFTEVPVVDFPNNDKRIGNAEKAITYIDAYDRVLSDSSTEQSASRQAYLLLKEAGDASSEFMEQLQKFGVVSVDGDGDAKWIEKTLDPQHTKLILSELEKNIYRFGIIVDNDKLMSISNPRKNQIDFIYRAMDNDCDVTEKKWQEALEYEDRILRSYWTVAASPAVADYNTYDINYVFNRNKPVDVIADLEAMERAGVKIPNRQKLIMLGYSEKEAETLSLEAEEEMIVIDDSANGEDEEGNTEGTE